MPVLVHGRLFGSKTLRVFEIMIFVVVKQCPRCKEMVAALRNCQVYKTNGIQTPYILHFHLYPKGQDIETKERTTT